MHIFLDGEVNDGFVFAVVHAGEASEVALAVNHLQTVDHVHRDVARCHRGVVAEEFFAVDEDFADFLTVDGDFAVGADFGAGEAADEVFNHSIWGGAVCTGVVFDGVLLDGDGGADAHYLHFVKHGGAFTQGDGAQRGIALPQVHIIICRLVAYVGSFHYVPTASKVFELEVAVDIGHHAIYCRAVASREQSHRCADEWLTLRVGHSSGDGVCRGHHSRS